MRQSVELDYDTCVDLLSETDVGRVALCTPTGPQILPVSYAVVESSVIFRTTPFSVLGTYAWNSLLAFEVDAIDRADEDCWSVVATGRGAMADDPEELAADPTSWDARPTAGDHRLVSVRLRWTAITGRRFGRI